MKPSSIGFEFPPDSSDGWDGFNEPGIEHFSGNPFEHLGREVPQNTIDAAISQNEPALIKVQLLKVSTASLPGLEDLRQAVRRCLEVAEQESDKALSFFSNADRLLKGRSLAVLQIADYNTTGVIGPCENGSPYFALVKASPSYSAP